MASEHDDSLEELLGPDEPAAKPAPEAKAPEAAPAEAPKAEPPAKAEPKPEKPAEKPKPAPAAPKKRSAWPIVTLVILVLLAVAVGLGWYANELRTQLATANDELQTAKTEASGMQSAAGKVADQLLPVIEENVAIAKLRAAAGDTEGAKYSLLLAKRYADMAQKLSAGTPPSKLRELTAQIEETGKPLGIGGEAAAGEAAAPAETTAPAATTEQTPAAPEAAAAPEPAPSATPAPVTPAPAETPQAPAAPAPTPTPTPGGVAPAAPPAATPGG